jgi:S1-C subfamily serine protease
VLNRKSWVFAILFVVCGLIVGVLIATKLELPSISTSAEVAAPEPNFRLATNLPLVDTVAHSALPSHTFVRAAEQVIPKVVSISSTKIYYASPAGDDAAQQQNPPARFRAPQQLRQSGRGSGVILTANGYILTNVHVVDRAQKITVTLSDNRSFDAKIAGLDPLTEIAVVNGKFRQVRRRRMGAGHWQSAGFAFHGYRRHHQRHRTAD